MRSLLLAVLIVLIAQVTVAAPPCVRYPKGKAPATHALPLCEEKPSGNVDPLQRIAEMRKTLPVPADWHFFLVTEADWRKIQLGTHSAYSNLAYKTTFIRESYVESVQDDKLRHTIAHEMGHARCQCTDESTADRIADQLTQDSQ